MIFVVAGIGRCGTSMMMRMLHRAGVPVYVDAGREGNSYETDKVNLLSTRMSFPLEEDRYGWLDQAEGKALKVLDPDVNCLPPSHKYKIILMTRNPTEQAKSMRKMLRAVDGKIVRKSSLRKIERAITAQLDYIENHTLWLLGSDFLVVRYEDVVRYAVETSIEIAEFLRPEWKPDPSIMASVVENRSPACSPYINEIGLLRKELVS